MNQDSNAGTVVDQKGGLVGYYGYPRPELLEFYKKKYSCCLLDLDIDYGHKDAAYIPRVYCQIVKNIINNAVFYKEKLAVIICSVGEEKCDGGRFASKILKDFGFNVVESRIKSDEPANNSLVISVSDLPLKQKVLKIMDTVHAKNKSAYNECVPVMGFWGVPPSDLSILEIFPDQTHIFGWTRCVEAGRPADLELEAFVPQNIPVVFYTQSFCQKSALAKYLADKYNGLYIDAERSASASTKAKIDAFIKLRVLKYAGS